MDVNPEIRALLDMGRERLNRYRDTFIPLEDLIVGEATRAGGATEQEEQAGLAKDAADRQARTARQSILARLGPASRERRAAFLAPMEVAAAGTATLAANEARRGARDTGFSKRLAAAGMGDKAVSQGLSSLSGGVQALLDQDRTQASRDNTAASVGAQIAGIQSRERESAADRAARAREFDESTRRWGLEFREGTRQHDLRRGDRRFEFDTRLGLDRDRLATDDEYNRARVSRWTEQDARDNRRQDYRDIGSLLSGAGDFLDSDLGGSIVDGLGSFFGFADGGRLDMQEGGDVDGPGTHTSDSIPAQLSNGEFVLPAEAVKIIDKLDPGLLERLQKLRLIVRTMGGHTVPR